MILKYKQNVSLIINLKISVYMCTCATRELLIERKMILESSENSHTVHGVVAIIESRLNNGSIELNSYM